MPSRTEEDDRVADLTRLADAMARALEAAASRIRMEAQSFAKDGLRSGAVGVAADVVQEFVNAPRSASVYLWDLATEAAKLDAHRRDLKAEVPK